MLVLAIDTATPDLIVGLVEDGEVRGEAILQHTRGHNEMLVPTTRDVLAHAGYQFNQLDAIVVGQGPGPFTGLRVGMATGAAFGDALGIPVYGVNTHDAIAHGIASEEKTLLVITDARRKEVYWSSYEHAQLKQGPEVCRPAELGNPKPESSYELQRVDLLSVPEQLQDSLPEHLKTATIVRGMPKPVDLVAVADFNSEPQPLVPLYLRRPDVKEPVPRPPSPAIPRRDS